MNSKHNELIHSVLENLGMSTRNLQMKRLHGGCINACYAVFTPNDRLVVKINAGSSFVQFQAEKEALGRLQNHSKFVVPGVLDTGQIDDTAYLLMEYIARGKTAPEYWTIYAERLYELHQNTSTEGYGLEYDNFIGSLPQSNSFKDDWHSFFVENRMKPMTRMAFDAGLLNKSDLVLIDSLNTNLGNLIIPAQPSLLHGDLWSGNTFPDSNGNPVILDPAMYYGHFEMELAFTQLFGGFPNEFLSAYYRLYENYGPSNDRFEICNLYPLLVHLNLFGRSYYGQIISTLEKFV